MQTKYIYFNTMIIACCYFYCIAITTLLIVLHCHYPLAVVIAIEHHIFVHRHVRAFLLMLGGNTTKGRVRQRDRNILDPPKRR